MISPKLPRGAWSSTGAEQTQGTGSAQDTIPTAPAQASKYNRTTKKRRSLIWLCLLLACIGTSWFAYQIFLVPQPRTFTPDWHSAHWIEAGDTSSDPSPVAYFRRSLQFGVIPDIAYTTITANQVFFLYVNGIYIGSNTQDFIPGETPQTYIFDIDSTLVTGTNIVGIRTANVDQGSGWGQAPSLLANISASWGHQNYNYGTDAVWQATQQAALAHPRMSKTNYDWAKPKFDATSWHGAQLASRPLSYPALMINPQIYQQPMPTSWISAGAGQESYYVRSFSIPAGYENALLRIVATGESDIFINDHLYTRWSGLANVPQVNVVNYLSSNGQPAPYRNGLMLGIYDITPYLHPGSNTIAVHILAPGTTTAKIGLNTQRSAMSLEVLAGSARNYTNVVSSPAQWHASLKPAAGWTKEDGSALTWSVPELIGRPGSSHTFYLPDSNTPHNIQTVAPGPLAEIIGMSIIAVLAFWLLFSLATLRRFILSRRAALELASLVFLPALAFEALLVALSRETLITQPFPYTGLWGLVLIAIVLLTALILWLYARTTVEAVLGAESPHPISSSKNRIVGRGFTPLHLAIHHLHPKPDSSHSPTHFRFSSGLPYQKNHDRMSEQNDPTVTQMQKDIPDISGGEMEGRKTPPYDSVLDQENGWRESSPKLMHIGSAQGTTPTDAPHLDLAYVSFPERVRPWMKRNWGIIPIFLITMPMVLYNPAYEPYWQDELSSYYAARYIMAHGIPAFPSGFIYPKGELFSYLLAFVMTIFGTNSPVVTRSISMTLFLASLPIFYVVGCKLFNRRVAWFATTMLAFSPYAMIWSRQTRMYEQAQFLVIIIMGVLYWAIQHRDKIRPIRIAILCIILAYFSHEEVFITFPALVICSLVASREGPYSFPSVLKKKHWWIPALIALAIISVQLSLVILTHPSALGTDQSRRPQIEITTDNIPFYFGMLFEPQLLKDGPTVWVTARPLLTVDSLLAVLGCVIALRRKDRRACYCALFLIISTLTLVFLFTMEADRYYYPLLPVYYLMTAYGTWTVLHALWIFARPYLTLPRLVHKQVTFSGMGHTGEVHHIGEAGVTQATSFTQARRSSPLRHGLMRPDAYGETSRSSTSAHTLTPLLHIALGATVALVLASIIIVPMLPISNFDLFVSRALGIQYRRHFADYDNVGQYMHDHMRPGDTVISIAPAVITLYEVGKVDDYFSVDRSLFLFEQNGQLLETTSGSHPLLNEAEFQTVLAEHNRIWLITDNGGYQGGATRNGRFVFPPPDFHLVYEGYGSGVYFRSSTP